MATIDPYQRRKEPDYGLYGYTRPARPTPDGDVSEFELVDKVKTPSKFEIKVITPWKNFVTNSPTVGRLYHIATYFFLPDVRHGVYQVLDRLLDESTVPEIRIMARLDQDPDDPDERDKSYWEWRSPYRYRWDKSDFVSSLRMRWFLFIDEGQDACGCSLLCSFLLMLVTGIYHYYIYSWGEPYSAFSHFLLSWSSVFALNGVVSGIATCNVYESLKAPFYAVEWPFKVRPKDPAFRGLWWGVDLLGLPVFWAAWSFIFGIAGMPGLPICEWLLFVSPRPDILPPQSTETPLLNIVASSFNRMVMYLCVACNLAHAIYTFNTVDDELFEMRESWKRRKDRMKGREDPCESPFTLSR